MADVLTHVLAGYILGVILASRYDWMGPEHVTLVMLGALSPDLAKVSILVPSATVEATLGVPFEWFALHTLGGNLVVILLVVVLVAPEHRRIAFLLLALGAVSHHLLDLLLFNASGYAYPVLWPLTPYSPPAGMLYHSSDRWPALLAGGVAVALWLLGRYRSTAGARVDG